MWFKWVLFGIFILSSLVAIQKASKGKHTTELTPGVQAFSALLHMLFAIGVLVYI